MTTEPGVDAPTTEWFVYYRQMLAEQAGELERLRRIEAAALRVASARRNGIVKDQAPLDALDAALEDQSCGVERTCVHANRERSRNPS
jgi:hypothetical protein